MEFGLDAILLPALVVVVIFMLLFAFGVRYKTVGPDEAMIVTGTFLGTKNVADDQSGRKIKIVRGGGAFIVPIFQKKAFVSLLSHKLDVSTPEVYTEQGVPVMADGVAIIKVGGSVEDVATAAEQFLGKPVEALKSEAQEVLEGHLRAILGSMTVEEVYRNRDKFAQEVQAVAAKDLKKMGLQIVSFTIKDVRDKQGYLEALGRPRVATVKRDAEVAEANAIRDAKVQKALAEEDWMKAELIRDINVAEATKENTLKVASFKKEQDMAKAEADQAYAIQESRSQQMAVEEQMKVELVRKEREIDLEALEIQRRERQYDAEVKKKADAERYSVEQKAEADKVKKMREAEAYQYEIETRAKATSEQKRLEGLAIADSDRAKGSAEADVIRAKGFAEAEAKEKLAEAFQKFGEAAVLDIIAKMLPELAGKIAEPLGNIDKLTVVDTGHGDGAARVSNYVTSLLATSSEMLKGVSGIDLEELVKGLMTKTGNRGHIVEVADVVRTAEPNGTAAPVDGAS
jgi:flotillin